MLEGRILAGTTNSSNLKGRIDLLNANNVALNNEIDRINLQKVTLQANYQALETRAESIRNTINGRNSQR
jgi:predicted  nucleic acid-binding Zn-ribbon protein